MMKKIKKIRLNALLAHWSGLKGQIDPIITGLSQDSRCVKSGDLFFACPGEKTDGRTYIDEAIARGVMAVMAQAVDGQISLKIDQGIPFILLPDLRNKIGPIAAKFYDDPSQKIPIFGVTGTNGKTSYTHLLAQTKLACNRVSAALTCNVFAVF